MRRFLVAFVVAFLLVCAPASALTVQGGTEDQRAYTQEVIEACSLDWQWSDERMGGVDVALEPHHEPYWDIEALTAGLAWPGYICADSRYTGRTLGEIVSHEWSHQIWYGVPAGMRSEWKAMVGPGDSSSWYTSPAEAFAECMRVALWPSDYWFTDYPRTNLAAPSVDYCRDFIALYRWSVECPFLDLSSEDTELRAAAGKLSHDGIILGYTDGTFGAYQPLLKRHVALIAERSGLNCALGVNDYTPALRSDVRDAIPGLTWLEERWDEPLTRSQLARLLWRHYER